MIKHARYNAGVSGSLSSAFSRDIATVDGRGQSCAVDERRFGKSVGYTPIVEWSQTGVIPLGSGNVQILGAGMDHDNTTPLCVVQIFASSVLRVYSGDSFSVESNTDYTATDWIVDQPVNHTYFPTAVVVHHGIIVLQLQRTVSGTIDGASYCCSQDKGVTWHGVPIVGDPDDFDVPAIAGGVASGQARGRQWAMTNTFPVGGESFLRSAWVPWADYLKKDDLPKGGQAGMFRIDRTTDTGQWTVSPNRLAYERWEVTDSGGLHAHSTAITAGGLLVHFGDVDYRNNLTFVELDLDNYQTATATATEIFGNFSASSTKWHPHAQPNVTAPVLSLPGAHIAWSDETAELCQLYNAIVTSADECVPKALFHRHKRNTPGGSFEGNTIVHCHHQYGMGYVASGVVDYLAFVSLDGLKWGEINVNPANATGFHYLYGNRIINIGTGNEIYAATFPGTVETVEPLQIAPGGANIVDTSWSQRNAPAANNSLTQVYYDGTDWRYSSNDSLLEWQPPGPPFPHSTPVYLAAADSTSSISCGRWYTQTGNNTPGVTSVFSDIWFCNLSPFGSRILCSSRSDSAVPAVLQCQPDNTRYEWNCSGRSIATSHERHSIEIFSSPSSGTEIESWRGLIALASEVFDQHFAYPVAPNATGPDELETLTSFTCGTAWTVGIVFQLPWNLPALTAGQDMTVATLRGDASNYIRVAYTMDGSNLGTIIVELVSGGVTVDTLVMGGTVSDWLQNNEVGEVIISSDGSDTWASARLGRWNVDTDSSVEVVAQGFNTLRFADISDVSGAVNPIMAWVEDAKALSELEQAQRMGQSLLLKAGVAKRLGGGSLGSSLAHNLATRL